MHLQCMCVHVCVYLCVHACVCVHTCMRACVCMCVCMHVCACVCITDLYYMTYVRTVFLGSSGLPLTVSSAMLVPHNAHSTLVVLLHFTLQTNVAMLAVT